METLQSLIKIILKLRDSMRVERKHVPILLLFRFSSVSNFIAQGFEQKKNFSCSQILITCLIIKRVTGSEYLPEKRKNGFS